MAMATISLANLMPFTKTNEDAAVTLEPDLSATVSGSKRSRQGTMVTGEHYVYQLMYLTFRLDAVCPPISVSPPLYIDLEP
jgi:hypothetical protein